MSIQHLIESRNRRAFAPNIASTRHLPGILESGANAKSSDVPEVRHIKKASQIFICEAFLMPHCLLEHHAQASSKTYLRMLSGKGTTIAFSIIGERINIGSEIGRDFSANVITPLPLGQAPVAR